MNLGHLILVLGKLAGQLVGVKLAVAASGLDDLGLLLQGEVLPAEIWANVLLEEAQNLVVGDGAGVGEVVNARLLVLGEEDGGREEIVEDGVGVGDIHNTVVLSNLGDKVTWVKIVADGHTKSEDEAVGVVLHDL